MPEEMRIVPLVLALLLSGADAACAAAAARDAGPRPRAAGAPLANATVDEVKARLGEPAVANAEGKGAMWTYRLEDCALMVFFKDEGRGLRVSGVTAGPRRRADPTPDAETCIADARRAP